MVSRYNSSTKRIWYAAEGFVPRNTRSLKQNRGLSDGELTEDGFDILSLACPATCVDLDRAQNHSRLNYIFLFYRNIFKDMYK